MRPADIFAHTSRMLFIAVTPFAPVPGTLLDSSTPAHVPLIDPRRVSAYEAVRACREEDFELISMPEASEGPSRRAYCSPL